MPKPQLSKLDSNAAMFLLMSQSSRADSDCAKQDIKELSLQRKELMNKVHKELRKIASEQKDQGFWDDVLEKAGPIARVAGLAAAAALTVSTFGAGGLVFAAATSALVLSAASEADQQFELLEKAGVSQETAGWVRTGAGVGSALLTGGVTAWGPGGANVLTRVAAVAQGASQGVVGGASIGSQVHQSHIEEASANATAARGEMKQTQVLVGQLIAVVHETLERDVRTVERAAELQATQSATLAIAAGIPA